MPIGETEHGHFGAGRDTAQLRAEGQGGQKAQSPAVGRLALDHGHQFGEAFRPHVADELQRPQLIEKAFGKGLQDAPGMAGGGRPPFPNRVSSAPATMGVMGRGGGG